MKMQSLPDIISCTVEFIGLTPLDKDTQLQADMK